jgi:hypothetical protein
MAEWLEKEVYSVKESGVTVTIKDGEVRINATN